MLLFLSCKQKELVLRPVSYAEFKAFVDSTDYVTDAEKFGWSIVQINVFDFNKVDNADWRRPDGKHPPRSYDLPVTQVSYNDALAYCHWAGTRLPDYDEYWKMVASDKRPVVADNMYPISPVVSVNIVGNVWDITSTTRGEMIRLAGGSLFCSEKTCHGTVKERVNFVDKYTGNINIGFSVIDEKE